MNSTSWGGTDTAPTPELGESLSRLRVALEKTEDDTLEVVAVTSAGVVAALSAGPFEQAALVEALQNVAFEPRAAAKAGEASLQVQVGLASLIGQTAALIEGVATCPARGRCAVMPRSAQGSKLGSGAPSGGASKLEPKGYTFGGSRRQSAKLSLHNRGG